MGGAAAPDASVVVPTVRGGPTLERMLSSLDDPAGAPQVIVVDNGSPASARVAEIAAGFEFVEHLRLDRNRGYSAAVNAGARAAGGAALVLLNDDCVCDPGFVRAIVEPLDRDTRLVMVAGLMRDARDPALVETAGIELDRTLLAFDHLNGEPVDALRDGCVDPLGPSGAAAAFDREAFLAAGGLDEAIFAYLEDVDLALRLRQGGARCALAPAASGTHEHSATLGPGSARKNYLMGFGRGYLLRKWSVVTPGRAPGVAARELVVCAGQAAIDRNLAGLRGRAAGWSAASRATRPYPAAAIGGHEPPSAASMLGRRLARRARLRRTRTGDTNIGGDTDIERVAPDGPAPASARASDGPVPRSSLIVFHVGGASGAARTLRQPAAWLASRGRLEVVAPEAGHVTDLYGELGDATVAGYEALVVPGSPRAAAHLPSLIRRQVGGFRALIRSRRPELVLVASAMIPAALVAARLEGVPALLRAAEILDAGRGRARDAAGSALTRIAGSLATEIVACSRRVARQYQGGAPVGVVHPPIAEHDAAADGPAFRRRLGIGADERLVLAVGSLSPMRGHEDLLEALVHLRRAGIQARLAIVGEPFSRAKDVEFAARLRALADGPELAGSVVFAGFQEAVGDAYAAADVVVNPARDPEAFGRAACEALAAGVPVVSTRVGAVPEVLRDGRTALLAPPADPGALAAEIRTLLADRELARRLAEAGRADVAARFGSQAALQGFRDAVGRATAPAPARAQGS